VPRLPWGGFDRGVKQSLTGRHDEVECDQQVMHKRGRIVYGFPPSVHRSSETPWQI